MAQWAVVLTRTLEPFRVSSLCSGPSEHKRCLQAVCSSLKYTTSLTFVCILSFCFYSVLATDNYLNGLSINIEFFGSYGLTSNKKKVNNGWLPPHNWYLDHLVNLQFNKTWVVPSCLLLPPPKPLDLPVWWWSGCSSSGWWKASLRCSCIKATCWYLAALTLIFQPWAAAVVAYWMF